jgi:hypothetical protein
MKGLGILDHMKLLKAAIPVKQNKVEVTSQLPVFKQIKNMSKKLVKNSGIFENDSFCLPFKENPSEL